MDYSVSKRNKYVIAVFVGRIQFNSLKVAKNSYLTRRHVKYDCNIQNILHILFVIY